MSQGWKLDGIDFFDYGVLVTKSAGVLNMPKIVDTSHDWLDLDGKDYWQPISDIKYQDNQIVLNCFIDSDSYANFKTAVDEFYAALMATNQRQLTAPYLSSNIECYVDSGVKVSQSNYIRSRQFGIFVLKLTVRNDSAFNLINILRNYSYNIVATVKTNNLKITKNLQGDSSLNLSFESNAILDIQKDDFIQYEYNGLGQDRFILNSEPSFTKKSTNKYVYSLKFDYQPILLERVQFLSDLNESDFYYSANMEDVLDLIITNIGRYIPGKFTKGTVVSTITKNHHFSSEDCYSVLKRIAGEYEVEYEFEKDNPNWWDYIINIKTQVANDIAITLEYGKGKGGYELSRGARIESEFFTKLYAFGSTTNIPADYRSGLRRLSFTANPLEQNRSLYGYKEKTIYFDDIFPNRTATVTGYFQVLEPDLTDEQRNVWPTGIYRVEDTTLDFDLNDYLIPGVSAKIVMKTGSLQGYEFGISKYINDDNFIYLIPFTDAGLNLPNASSQIAIGDTYTLVNINQPASYITIAENALQVAAIDALADGSTPKFVYTGKIDPSFILDNSVFFEAGDRLTLIDTDYNINGAFKISSLTYNDYTGIYDLIFSDKTIPSRLAYVEQFAETQERTNESTNDTQVGRIRDGRRTTGDVDRRLFSPIDDRLNVDNIVRSNSLDPVMLSLDSGYIQAGLTGVIVTENFDGDFDKTHFQSGEFKLNNVNGLNRFDIAQLKSAGGTYDPTRTWVVPETLLTIPNSNDHLVYLKLTETGASTASELILSETHIETKQDTGFLYYQIGTTGAGGDERSASMVFGNTKSASAVLSSLRREVPIGVVDGVNNIFTISHTPVTDTEDIYINGQLRYPTLAYTLSGNTITFVDPPWVGSYLLAKYIKQ